MSVRSWPGIFFRRPVEEQSVKVGFQTPNRRGRSTTERILPKRDGHGRPKQPDTSGASTIGLKAGDRPKNENLIISVHIPKTGGSTFTEILRTCAQEVFYLDYDVGATPRIELFRRGQPLTMPFESISGDLESLPGRSIIHGHFVARKYLCRFPNAVYVTWLRDPVERVVSHYLFWQRTHFPGDVLWEQVGGQKMSIEQFVEVEFALNVQYKFLAPLGVEEFDFIGITEEYDRSLELFRRLFCPEVQFDATVRKMNNPSRQGKFYDVDPKFREKVLKLNERDVHTYINGVRRFRDLCGQVGLACWSLALQFGYGGETDHWDYLIQFFC